jgi:hypothetical protein
MSGPQALKTAQSHLKTEAQRGSEPITRAPARARVGNIKVADQWQTY